MKIFVYGTLKTGERNWHRYFTPVRGKPAQVRGHRLHEREDGVAVMAPTGVARHVVHGEVFNIDRRLLAALDYHEGVGARVYDRRIVSTMDGERVWAYVNPRLRHLPVIEGGRWAPPKCPICEGEFLRRFRGWMGTLYIHDMKGRWPSDWCVTYDPEVVQQEVEGE